MSMTWKETFEAARLRAEQEAYTRNKMQPTIYRNIEIGFDEKENGYFIIDGDEEVFETVEEAQMHVDKLYKDGVIQ